VLQMLARTAASEPRSPCSWITAVCEIRQCTASAWSHTSALVTSTSKSYIQCTVKCIKLSSLGIFRFSELVVMCMSMYLQTVI